MLRMLRSTRHEPRRAARAVAKLATLIIALAPLACAGAHEEPPQPPPPPVDPGTFSGPARAPAPVVDLRADLDGGDLWFDADTGDAAAATANGLLPTDAGTDARPPTSSKRKH